MTKINFADLKQQWSWHGHDRWKVALDPYRDWRRLLIGAGLGSLIIIGAALCGAALVRGRETGSSGAVASSTTSLLLDETRVDQATAFIFDQQAEFARVSGIPPEGVEPSSTP